MSSNNSNALEVAIRLLVAEDNVTQEIVKTSQANHPKNTKKAFDKKQQEFIDWARHVGYQPPETVYESKLARFLKEEVVGHKSRSKCKNNEVPKISNCSAVCDCYHIIMEMPD